MLFSERAKLGMKKLAKQKPVTLEEARAQARWLKEQSSSKVKNKGVARHVEKIQMSKSKKFSY